MKSIIFSGQAVSSAGLRFLMRSGRIYANGKAAVHTAKAAIISITECCFKKTVEMLISTVKIIRTVCRRGVRRGLQ